MTAGQLIEAAMKVAGEFALADGYSCAGCVGAALLSEAGNLYTGICIDLPGGMGFCAEHSAAAEMLKNRETKVAMMVAVDEKGRVLPPCGRCREMLFQLDHENLGAKVIVGEKTVVTLDRLMPYREAGE